jgi:nucleoside 2-deoxyribosyltransferase
MATIYLCGPIANCSDAECIDWRQEVTKRWSGKTLDPMRRDYRGVKNAPIKEIVELDKIDICQSDIVLVNYVKPSVGTSMEVLYAFEHGKMVVVVNESQELLSPWLVYHSQLVFPSIKEALDFLEKHYS